MNKRQHENSESYNQIHSLVAQTQELADIAVKEIIGEIDSIIKSRAHDTNRIEHILDHMLGFCFSDKMLFEFKRLCRYLYAIDPQSATFYVHTYWEMWEEDGKIDPQCESQPDNEKNPGYHRDNQI